ncbi:MAG: hypothetical protein LBJ73_02905 [Rickettsiales bacterium]|jgi:hypothetical protein|nr:hypothetical protein [Rickettsiales bacterium]
MNLTKKIFNVIVLCAALMVPVVARAAADTSCDDEKNEFINQRLALCSTHAYNIGMTTNPESSAERQIMNEVVALKTTIMTQQMKKQYDYLETTVKRFKTQLEKAILVAKAQAAGAAAESGTGGGSSSGGANSSMAGTRDCSQGFNTRDKLQCLQQNFGVIYGATSNGTKNPVTEVRKQITTDMNILINLVVYIGSDSTYAYEPNKSNDGKVISNDRDYDSYKKCTGTQSSISTTCIGLLQAGIAKLTAAQEQSERASTGGGR